jgi:hypothetical protein
VYIISIFSVVYSVCFFDCLFVCFELQEQFFSYLAAITIAGVTEKSDSRRILTPGSFFYVEM